MNIRLAIKRKKDNLYYGDLEWAGLDKARLFKREQDIKSFLSFNGYELHSFENGSTSKDMVRTKVSGIKIVKLKLVELK
jgi:hypothetical protein